MRTSTLEQLKRHLRPGRVYRREDLLSWSQSVDRHLKNSLSTGLCKSSVPACTTALVSLNLGRLPRMNTNW